MKFTAKYEIMELLTSGRVSTFLVRERATQEQFVVHSFDCPRMFSADDQQPATFQQFASLAPNPAGRIIEVGFDEGSVSAYIVTGVPTAAALQDWIRSYRVFAERKAAGTPILGEDATAELSAAEVNAILSSNRGPAPSPDLTSGPATQTFPLGQPPSASAQTKGEFTKLFEDLGAFQRFADTGAHAKSEPEPPRNSIPTGQLEIPPAASRVTPAPPVTTQPSESRPGSFTQEFLLEKKDNSGTPEIRPAQTYPTESGTKEPGSFTREFLAAKGNTQPSVGTDSGRTPRIESPAKTSETASIFAGSFDSSSSEPKGPATKFDWSLPEAAKSGDTGEFTSFFREPFDQPGTGKKLDTIPDLADASPAHHPTGEFTKIFGKGSPESSKFSQPEPMPEKSSGSFTQIFGNDSDRGTRLGASRLDTSPGQSPLRSLSEPAVPPAPASTPAAREPFTFSPVATDPSLPKATSIPASSRDSTLLYRAGPADATDVFRVPGGADAPPVEQAPSGPSEFTVFLSRSQVNAALPPEPAVAPPPASSAAPPVPQFAFPPAPPMPQFAAPPMPKPPALPAAPRPGSIWPLITVLTILIAVGALLVMYFAFRH
jgi:hypothetical protein